MKRREFLVSCAAGCVAAGIVPVTAHATAPDKYFSGAPRLSKQRFQELVNSQFRVYSNGWNSVPIKLTAVHDGPEAPGLDQFSILFHGPKNASIQAGSYLVNHHKDGDFLLYLEPAGSQANTSTTFVATFSLLS
jgi:hypothetical protein